MRRIAFVVVVGVASAVVAGCGGGSGGTSSTAATTFDPKKPVTLTVWSGFTERELGIWNRALAGFQKLHPNVKIKSVGSIDNNKIVAGIRSGNPPDVALSSRQTRPARSAPPAAGSTSTASSSATTST
jgi:multiple sugar transport system substrate-binding protein